VSAQIPVVLVGNKIDLEEERVVSLEEGRELAKKYRLSHFETSAKTNHNINEVFFCLGNHPPTPITAHTHHRTHATQRTSRTLTVVERACSAGDHAVAREAHATIERRGNGQEEKEGLHPLLDAHQPMMMTMMYSYDGHP
jgi:50S ribosomal subunit-associated GTPase HflX